MLGRLVLLLLQIVLGWFGANAIMGWIGGSVPGAFSIYVFAIVAAIVVFLVGIIAAQVLQGVWTPGSGTLTASRCCLRSLPRFFGIWPDPASALGDSLGPCAGQVCRARRRNPRLSHQALIDISISEKARVTTSRLFM
jgi:hypothetical protein